MAFAEDFSNPNEEDKEGLREYEKRVEKATNDIFEGNYENAYDRLVIETDGDRGTEKDFGDHSILLNRLAKESSFDGVPEYLSALTYDSRAMYDLEEAEEAVKKFAEELNNLYVDE